MTITVTVTIDDTNEKVMLNDLLDIDAWVQEAVSGKVNNCWKRMQSQWTTKLMNDPTFTDSIPSNKTDFVNLVTSREDYLTRAEKDTQSE